MASSRASGSPGRGARAARRWDSASARLATRYPLRSFKSPPPGAPRPRVRAAPLHIDGREPCRGKAFNRKTPRRTSPKRGRGHSRLQHIAGRGGCLLVLGFLPQAPAVGAGGGGGLVPEGLQDGPAVGV